MCFAATFVCYIDRVNISVAIIPMAEEFQWDLETQGIILSFYVGYLIMQVMGGFLADRFGGKIVLGLGVLIWSFFTVVTPWAAFSGMDRAVGCAYRYGAIGEAVTFPSVYSLITRWFPVHEKAKAVAFNASGIPIGTVFALVVTPIIVSELGWEWAFYLFGLVLFGTPHGTVVTNTPENIRELQLQRCGISPQMPWQLAQ